MVKSEELKPGARGCLAKAADDEMLFIMRAQDATAPKMIMLWIAENLNAPDEKLREAFECALTMLKHPKRKKPD